MHIPYIIKIFRFSECKNQIPLFVIQYTISKGVLRDFFLFFVGGVYFRVLDNNSSPKYKNPVSVHTPHESHTEIVFLRSNPGNPSTPSYRISTLVKSSHSALSLISVRYVPRSTYLLLTTTHPPHGLLSYQYSSYEH